MLAKLIGSALIIGATTCAGWAAAARYAKRPAQLRDLQTGLAILQTEVEYGATPLPEALERAARAAGPPVGAIFAECASRLRRGGGATAGEALEAALDAAAGATYLGPEELSAMRALGAVLGASGRADQIRHLQLARRRLEAEEARARDERQRYERMARYLGVLSGAALVLILV